MDTNFSKMKIYFSFDIFNYCKFEWKVDRILYIIFLK